MPVSVLMLQGHKTTTIKQIREPNVDISQWSIMGNIIQLALLSCDCMCLWRAEGLGGWGVFINRVHSNQKHKKAEGDCADASVYTVFVDLTLMGSGGVSECGRWVGVPPAVSGIGNGICRKLGDLYSYKSLYNTYIYDRQWDWFKWSILGRWIGLGSQNICIGDRWGPK